MIATHEDVDSVITGHVSLVVSDDGRELARVLPGGRVLINADASIAQIVRACAGQCDMLQAQIDALIDGYEATISVLNDEMAQWKLLATPLDMPDLAPSVPAFLSSSADPVGTVRHSFGIAMDGTPGDRRDCLDIALLDADGRPFGTIQSCNVAITFPVHQSFQGFEPGPPGVADSIRVDTDFIYPVEDPWQEGGECAIVARDGAGELWRCDGCVIDRPGKGTDGRYGKAITRRTFRARSCMADGQTVTVPAIFFDAQIGSAA